MNYSNKFADTLKALGAALVLLISVNACTEVDDRLGSNYLPHNQKVKIRVKQLEGVETYLYKEDTLASTRLGYAYLGRERSPIFGDRQNSVVLQFVPRSIPYKNGYGFNPIIDSMYLVLPLYSVYGDSTKVQKFEIYGINGPELLHMDSIYYTNFPIDDYKDKLLFRFEHTGKRNVMTKLNPTVDGLTYLKKIVGLDLKTYKSDSLFLRAFPGLYITPANDSPVDAAVYATSLESAGMLFYGRSHDSIDHSAILDTISAVFNFADKNVTIDGIPKIWRNVSINLVDFDYTGSTLGTLETATNKFRDTLETSPTQPLMYIQPMSGVTGFLRFTDELINTLKNLRNDETDGEYYPSIMINQALMYIWLDDDSTPTLNTSMNRLGSYANIKTLMGIPDYLYLYEAYQRSQNATANYTLPYNGYLNRSNGYYELDITSFVQQLAKTKKDDPDYKHIWPTMHLGPEAYGFYDFGRSVLKGSGSNKPIQIRLTYMLIEGSNDIE